MRISPFTGASSSAPGGLECKVCSKQFTGPESMNQHLESEKHVKKVQDQKEETLTSSPQQSGLLSLICKAAGVSSSLSSAPSIKTEVQSNGVPTTKLPPSSSNEANYVGALQERLAAGGVSSDYRDLPSSGADHTPTFSVEVVTMLFEQIIFKHLLQYLHHAGNPDQAPAPGHWHRQL